RRSCSGAGTAVRSQIPTVTSGGSATARKAAISHTRSSTQTGEVFYEPNEDHAKVRQEHHRDRQDVQRAHGRGTRRAERDDRRAESGRGQGGGSKRGARADRRDAAA